MAEWDDSVESHEVDTLRAQIAKLKIELEQLLGQLLVAEQQRDAAHAALTEIAMAAGDNRRSCLTEGSILTGDFWAKEFASIERRANAALAASAPQQKNWQAHYSGDGSVVFWSAVNRANDPDLTLYKLACDLQTLEGVVLNHLKSERFKPAPAQETERGR